jgi:methyl-accepting chemotaxis protein
MKTKSIRTQISIYVLIISIVTSIVIGVFSYTSLRTNLEKSIGIKALDLAKAISVNIDGDSIHKYDQTNEKDDNYNTIRDYLSSVKANIDVKYIYIMTDSGSDYKYIMEGVKDGDNLDEIVNLGDLQSKGEYGAEPQQVLSAGDGAATSLYSNGEYGLLLSGFAPIFDSNHKVVAILGIDISAQMVQDSVLAFLPIFIAIMMLSCLATFFLIRYSVIKIVIRPIKTVQDAALSLAEGNFNILLPEEYLTKNNEIGTLSRAFATLSEQLNQIKTEIVSISEKKISSETEEDSKGDFKRIKESINNIIRTYHTLLSDFEVVSKGLTERSNQVSEISNSLASGSNEQTCSIENFSESITILADSARQNYQTVGKATSLIKEAEAGISKCNADMEEVLSAMTDIRQVSDEISTIMDEITEIAFVTNLLSLNASIEAVRAGKNGKGFAVVAEEVRKLAAKSNLASRRTEALLTKSTQAVESGKTMTEITGNDLKRMYETTNQVITAIQDISLVSQKQENEMEQIKHGIHEIASVIKDNSEKADETANASSELSRQADFLEQKINEFIF